MHKFDRILYSIFISPKILCSNVTNPLTKITSLVIEWSRAGVFDINQMPLGPRGGYWPSILMLVVRVALLALSLISAARTFPHTPQSLLKVAAFENPPNLQYMQMALARGADVNYRYSENEGMTALMLLVEAKGCGPAIDLVLAQPSVDVNAKDNLQYTALHFASGKDGQLEAVQKLIATGKCLLNEEEGQQGNTPLHLAAVNGNTDALCLLLAQPGVDKNKVNRIGNTALHAAIYSKSMAVVQLLLNAGFNCFTLNNSGFDAFRLAVKLDQRMILRQLLDHVNPDKSKVFPDLGQSYALAQHLGKADLAAIIQEYMNFTYEIIIQQQ